MKGVIEVTATRAGKTIEGDTEYYDAAMKRLADHQKQLTMF